MQEVQQGEQAEEGTEGTPGLIGTHSAANTHGELLNCLMGAISWLQELEFLKC